MVMYCTKRQTEAMLLKLISDESDDLKHFKRFQKFVPGLGKAVRHCYKAIKLMDDSSSNICHTSLCFMSKYDSLALYFLSFSLSFCLSKTHNCTRQLLKKDPLFWHNYLCTESNSDPLWDSLSTLSAPVNKPFLKVLCRGFWHCAATLRKTNESVKSEWEGSQPC